MSGLNHAAYGLPVNASRPGSPQAHASLGFRLAADLGRMGLDTHRVSNKVSKITSRHLVPLDRAFPAHAQMHYTTIGEEVYDQSSWGVVLAKGPAGASGRRAGGGQIVNFLFTIEPGNANYKVTASRPIKEDTYLTSMMPHMHVRGKSAKYTVKHEDGSEVVALWVPNFDFNWQLNYQLEEPIFMPKDSTLETEFHYDNSPTNRFNPDPTQTVHWGDQTWEEMMLGYYGTVNPDAIDTTEGQQ